MRTLLFLLCLLILQISSSGQKISYDIPEGYEHDISKADYKKIVDLSVALVARRYTIDFVKDGAIQLIKGQDLQTLNLHNLIAKCTAVKDQSQWSSIVQEHFENLFASLDEQKKIDPANYETVKKYLSLRIYPKEVVVKRGGVTNLVSKTDLEGTYTLLMLDLPGAFSVVQKQMFDLWKLDTATVFKVAQENVDKQPIEKITDTLSIGGMPVEISFIQSEDYAASYALDLANNAPELVGEWGSVIAIPNKGLAEICKISKDKPVDFVKFVQASKQVVGKYYQEHPQRVSDQFFLYYNGQFTRINVLTDAKGNVNVISPYGLTELMTEKK